MDIAEEMDGLYLKSVDPWEYSKANRFPILFGLMDQYGVDGRMLEMGCGEGILSDGIRSRFKDDYIGIDVSEVAISRARKSHRNRKGMLWIVGDVSSYAFKIRFDMIVASDVYPYLNDILDFHRKTVGLLNKGGVLIATSCCSSYCGSEMFPGLEFQDRMTTLFTGRALTKSVKKEYESEYYEGRRK